MTEDNDKSKGGISLNVNIGKEIDVALGDVVRGLLVKPAEAVGELTSDAIGILGDRIKLKRQLNARLGLEEVYKKLEENSVDLKDITPPKEEELHLLVNGLSLTDDENLRDMWAGLFAKALEPGSDVKAERPFLNVLQSFSPQDAKIIDLLAFIIRVNAKQRTASQTVVPKDWQNITKEEKEAIESAQKENSEILKESVNSIEKKAEEYGLKSLTESSWSENLMRLGVIERTPVQNQYASPPQIRSFDERELFNALDHLHKSLSTMARINERNMAPPREIFVNRGSQLSIAGFGSSIQLEIRLTSFGLRLATACGLISKSEAKPFTPANS